MGNKHGAYDMVKLVKRYIKEAKQVGVLYHVCSLESLFKYIIKNDTLSGSGNFQNWLLGGRTDVVSFTRDKRYTVSTDNTRDTSVLFSFTVDGDKLSNNHKIIPYNDLAFFSDGEPIDFSYDEDGYTGRTESEEVVVGKIDDFSKYILNIRFIIDARSFFPSLYMFNFNNFLSYIEKTYAMLLSCKPYLGRFPIFYGNEMSPYLNKQNKVFLKKSPDSLSILLHILDAIRSVYKDKNIDSKIKSVFSEYLTSYAKYRLIRPILTWDMLSNVLPKEIFKKNFINSRLRKTGGSSYYGFSSTEIEDLLTKFVARNPDKKEIIDLFLNNKTDRNLAKILSLCGEDLASMEFNSINEPEFYTLGISTSTGDVLCKYLLSDYADIIKEDELISYIDTVL